MPVQVVCEKCGHLLYKGTDPKSPFEIVKDYNGKCPKCSRKLSPIPIKVKIKPLVEIGD